MICDDIEVDKRLICNVLICAFICTRSYDLLLLKCCMDDYESLE